MVCWAKYQAPADSLGRCFFAIVRWRQLFDILFPYRKGVYSKKKRICCQLSKVFSLVWTFIVQRGKTFYDISASPLSISVSLKFNTVCMTKRRTFSLIARIFLCAARRRLVVTWLMLTRGAQTYPCGHPPEIIINGILTFRHQLELIFALSTPQYYVHRDTENNISESEQFTSGAFTRANE